MYERVRECIRFKIDEFSESVTHKPLEIIANDFNHDIIQFILLLDTVNFQDCISVWAIFTGKMNMS